MSRHLVKRDLPLKNPPRSDKRPAHCGADTMKKSSRTRGSRDSAGAKVGVMDVSQAERLQPALPHPQRRVDDATCEAGISDTFGQSEPSASLSSGACRFSEAAHFGISF
jgi:hypothetical protein